MCRIRPRATFDVARGKASQMLVAGRIGIISAARAISSVSGRSDGGSSDADRHAATHIRTTVSAAVIDPGAMDAAVIASATNASATAAIRKGVR
jgi:anti-sigma factor RsiW